MSLTFSCRRPPPAARRLPPLTQPPSSPSPASRWQGLNDGKYICKFFGPAAKKGPYTGPKGVGQMSGVVQK